MADQPSTVLITDNDAAHRYEAHVDGALAAYVTYELADGAITFVHTKTEPLFEGHGVASRLVEVALDEARDRGLSVIAVCPFVASYIDHHPAYADLVRLT
jgi:predicted GNAT family acetyltransferase